MIIDSLRLRSKVVVRNPLACKQRTNRRGWYMQVARNRAFHTHLQWRLLLDMSIPHATRTHGDCWRIYIYIYICKRSPRATKLDRSTISAQSACRFIGARDTDKRLTYTIIREAISMSPAAADSALETLFKNSCITTLCITSTSLPPARACNRPRGVIMLSALLTPLVSLKDLLSLTWLVVLC